MSEQVKVAVRSRPLSTEEKNEGLEDVVIVNEQRREIFIFNEKKKQKKQFTFDYTYGSSSKQKDIYEDCAYGIVESVIEGYNGTIFAYGQTGTGKTYTMQGSIEDEYRGIIPRTFEHIFNTIHGTESMEFLVSCSMLELYNEQVYDLLDFKEEKLDIHQKPDEGFYVKGLSVHDMKSDRECVQLLDQGSNNRKKAETSMNKESSRSHSIFSISIETSHKDEEGNVMIRKGKLNLVDLAGSERQKKTNVGGIQMKEAQKINYSLVCLGKVISALVKNPNGFIPYRDSKLTKLLMNSLGGNAKTFMIANIGPASKNYEESIQTLRYANQAKDIKNKPIINEDPKDAKLREIQDEITKLQEYLQDMMGKNAGGIFDGEITENMKSQVIKKMIEDKEKLDEKYRQETEKIMKNKEITEKQRKQLLDELRKNEERENRERDEKKQLLEKIAQVKEKIIQGDKQKEEFLRVQKELHEQRQKRLMIEQEKMKLKEEAENAEMEKGILENKYVSQKEELKEKDKLNKRIKQRFQQVKSEYEEFIESFNMDIKNLEEENLDLEEQIGINDLIIKSYFDEETIEKFNQALIYTPFYDTFKFSNTNEETTQLYHSFVKMKKIQEQDFAYSRDLLTENRLLMGNDNPFVEVKIVQLIQIK